jgi:valyl-tRNA synthetase
MDNKKEIPKAYDPQETEKRIYSLWEKSGFFNPDVCIEKKKSCPDSPFYSIVLPPANVTGVLHVGHALGITIEDILIRFHRMKGYQTLWVPGTDHAAIATQSKVEQKLQKEENKSRHDLGKEEFLKKVNLFALESQRTILEQIKKMGASVDWSREAYTLDKQRNKAVVTAFKKLYDQGLVYQGTKVVNWDPKGQTTISDDEVVYQETEGELYSFFYDKDFPIAIATTRPETKLGDTAVAVNPKDKRYQKYVNKEFQVNFVGQQLKIKVVADKEIDPSFGTGAVGVTPAHSFLDSQIAQRHDLKTIQVIDEKARIMPGFSLYSGMKIQEAREKIVEKLKQENLLIKQEKIKQNLARAERTNGIVEPLPKKQWFIDVNKEFSFPHSNLGFVKEKEKVSLKELMRRAVSEKEIKIVPQRFEKIYFHWVDNLRDWCISRQIWFGHQIPVYYHGKEVLVQENPPQQKGWQQDPDTLDTWFSSGLWTFSALGWPQEKNDLKYHPTNVLETAYDILFFWVARMILMSTFLLGQVPFHDVYLHGIIRDQQGKKMSKSLGNSINPTEMADKYGTDALRMSLIIGSAPGNDTKVAEPKIKAQKHFANKIWNASRFVLSLLPENEKELKEIISGSVSYTKKDIAWQKKLSKHLKEVSQEIERYRLDLAAEKIYQYFWHTFADLIIEESKIKIREGTEKERLSSLSNLYRQLTEQLKIIHPFMPFITEEIWSLIPKKPESEKILMVEKWPIK